jgi:hypothetical protein
MQSRVRTEARTIILSHCLVLFELHVNTTTESGPVVGDLWVAGEGSSGE